MSIEYANKGPVDGATRNGQNNSLTVVEGESQKLPYPKSVLLIISNEFCERFNYYGLRTILVLYLTQKLEFDNDTATVIFHTFVSMSWFMCVFGAILSDSWLGKFKTILYVSFVYSLGSLVIAVGAVPTLQLSATTTTVIGLLLIAIGSGGIKPCVSAFGGDQFTLPAQAAQLASFFSLFYFAIEAGAFVSSFVTPILRQDVHCFGDNDCYSLAFGVPGVLMILSIVIFACGKPFYRINPPSDNIFTEIVKCIKHAISTKIRDRTTKSREHWLDYSEEKFGKQLVADIKVLLRIIVLYIPLPLFWALYDQQSSRWTFQAANMNGDIGFYVIKPDQMFAVNTMLVLVFIPIFQTAIYPLLARIGIRRPLQKISIGMFSNALSFLVSGLIDLELEKTPSNSMSMLWQLPQYIIISVAEVAFGVTCYEFSYAQAPASMKTVLQACWLLTFAFGNIIIVIETFVRPRRTSQADESFFYAGLMVLGTLLFMVLAKNYKGETVRNSETELVGSTNDDIAPIASTNTIDTIVLASDSKYSISEMDNKEQIVHKL